MQNIQIPRVLAIPLSTVMTDILIILLENVQKLSQSHLWFDKGLDSDNSRNYINISKLSKELDNAKALPGTDTLTLVLIRKSGPCY